MEKNKTTPNNAPIQENFNDLFYYTDVNGRLKRSKDFDTKRQKLMEQVKKEK